jgi:hypothetical protein
MDDESNEGGSYCPSKAHTLESRSSIDPEDDLFPQWEGSSGGDEFEEEEYKEWTEPHSRVMYICILMILTISSLPK